MLVLGLDIATRCGWALGRPGGRPRYGIWRLKESKADYQPVGGEMGKNLRDLCFLKDDRPELIVLEAPIPPYNPGKDEKGDERERKIARSVESICIPQRACGAVHAIAACYAIPVYEVSASTIRKLYLGRANFGKPDETKRQVINRCRLLKFVDPGFADDNVCDAIATWFYGCSIFGKAIPRELVMFGEAAR